MTEPVRADVWLWAARWFRTRALAKAACVGGKVEVNGQGCKPAKGLKPGDRLRIHRGEERFEVELLLVSEQRGPASMAQTLYRETEDSLKAREQAREQRRASGGPAPAPPGRPDKKARRALTRLQTGAD